MGSKEQVFLTPHQLSMVACAAKKPRDSIPNYTLRSSFNSDGTFSHRMRGTQWTIAKGLARTVLMDGNFRPLQKVILTPSTKHFLHDASNIFRVA
jgi:hypothetical protein